MAINTKLIYDEDGFCRLCSRQSDDHTDECPGSILHKLRYEVIYSGRNCSRGCCGTASGSNTGDTLMEAATATAQDVSECVSYHVEARMVVDLDDDIKALVRAEAQRLSDQKRAEEEAEEARDRIRVNTDQFNWAVQLLEAERGDLTPEAYERRMRELRDKYRALGIVFSDPTVDGGA